MHKGLIGSVVVMLAAGVFAQATNNVDVEATIKTLKKDLSMGSVAASNFSDKEGKKWERIKVTTDQEKDSLFMGTMRFTVEVTDKTTNYYGQINKVQSKHPAEYAGKDEWSFEIAHDAMDKPKITAYAVEYGWETNKVFTPVLQKFNKAESADEIMARNKDPKKKLKITAKTKAFRIESGGD